MPRLFTSPLAKSCPPSLRRRPQPEGSDEREDKPCRLSRATEEPVPSANMLSLFPSPLQKPDAGLPPSWEVRHSNSKNLPYYFNSQEKQSRWEPPEGTDTEKLKVYMAKYHSPSAAAGSAGGSAEGKIRAAHLLVKHTGSRRPSSWKEVRSAGVFPYVLLPRPSW